MIPESEPTAVQRYIAAVFKVPLHVLGPSPEREANDYINNTLREAVQRALDDALISQHRPGGIWGLPVVTDELHRHGPTLVGHAEAQALYAEAERLVKKLARGVDDSGNPGLYCPCNPNRPEEPDMPATTFRPASPRQIDLINSLRQERGLAAMDDIVAENLSGGRDGTASSAISTLMAMPRTGSRTIDAEVLPTPTSDNRTGRMLLAGGVVATVTMPDGRHITLKARTRKPTGRGGYTNAAPGDEGARTTIKTGTGRYLATVRPGWEIRWGRGISVPTKDAIRALFGYATTIDEHGGHGAYLVQVESRCGRCTRQLTDPVSIARGIGPECFGRDTGSRHVTAADIQDAAAASSQQIAEAEARNDTAFATREREQEQAAFTSDPDYQRFIQGQTRVEAAREELALNLPAPAERTATELARETIALALKAAAEDEEITEREAQRALATFDRLAGS